MARKTFLLGVGAQKAGTTWLHNALSEQRESAFGFEKEYHALTGMYLPGAGQRRREIIKNWIEKKEDYYSSWRGSPKAIRLSFLLYHGAYYDYFASLLRNPEVKLTGDITPIYSSLPSDVFSIVRSEFEVRGIAVLPIFIMRNPVYRLRSYVRMTFRNAGIVPSYDDEIKAMRSYIRTEDDLRRVNYEATVNAVKSAFGSTALFFFYENFFTPSALELIGNRIGFELKEVNFERRVGASTTSLPLLKKDYLSFANEYRDIFAFCRKAFPTSEIDEIWKYQDHG